MMSLIAESEITTPLIVSVLAAMVPIGTAIWVAYKTARSERISTIEEQVDLWRAKYEASSGDESKNLKKIDDLKTLLASETRTRLSLEREKSDLLAEIRDLRK